MHNPVVLVHPALVLKFVRIDVAAATAAAVLVLVVKADTTATSLFVTTPKKQNTTIAAETLTRALLIYTILE